MREIQTNRNLFYQAIEAEALFRQQRARWLHTRQHRPDLAGLPPTLSIGGRLEPIRQEYLEREIDQEFRLAHPKPG